MSYAILSNVQRGSLHDGPGVRTTFFFQGCNLRCVWCHNPETISMTPSLMTYGAKCIGCGQCEKVCKRGLTRKDCICCGDCTEVCPADARVMSGKMWTTDEMFKMAQRESRFYGTEGGVTCSGGEPMLQWEAVLEFLTKCKDAGMHTAVDTAGNVPWVRYEKLMPVTDLFLMDLKLSTDEEHRRWTGVSRSRIKENIANFAKCGREVWIRMPIIPGVNATEEHLKREADELLSVGFTGLVELLPFHRLGESKYGALGWEYPFAETEPPTNERMEELRGVMKSFGMHVKTRVIRDQDRKSLNT